MNALDLATRYRRERHWFVIPLLPRTKIPGERGRRTQGWQRQRFEVADLPTHFAADANIGGLLGADSNVWDIDVDAQEALPLASAWLPATPTVFGRPSKRRSHYLYRLDASLPTKRFEDPEVERQVKAARSRDHAARRSSTLIEARGDGAQTVLPGSVHPVGEAVCWEDGGDDADPALVEAGGLLRSVARIAAGSLLVRCWSEGARHQLTLPLARVLLESGWSSDEAANFLTEIARAAADEEWRDRRDAIRTTVARLAGGQPTQGFTALADLIGAPRARKISDWLELRKTPVAAVRTVHYRATPEGLLWDRPLAGGGSVAVPLTNFAARITADVIRDDGDSTAREFEVEAALDQHSRRVLVPAAQFGSLGWVPELLGPKAVVFAGNGVAAHARVAMQQVSDPTVSERRIFTHTGWRRIDGADAYLHAGGAIGASGAMAGIEVELPSQLAPAHLALPVDRTREIEVVRASLHFLEVAPDCITVPLLGAVVRAVLGGASTAVHLSGRTGAGKSALAALAQQFFGAGFDAEHLPGVWSSTGNALETLAFAAKDMLLVVDDFAPSGAQTDVQRLQREADRLLRAQGNLAGRQRLGRNLALVPARPPRGLILSTGEDVPGGQSLRARMVVIEVGASLDWARLTDCQRDAGGGVYAEALAGLIRWLAPRLDIARKAMRETITLARADAALTAQHRRVPSALGGLYAAFACFVDYAQEVGALDDSGAVVLRGRAQSTLRALAIDQANYQATADPARRFLTLIRAALSSGRGHLAGDDLAEGVPRVGSPTSWGWRLIPDRDGGHWQPQGQRLGWVTDQGIWLEPTSAYAAAVRLAAEANSPLGVSLPTLVRRMHEQQLLASTERESHGTFAVRRTLAGRRHSVLHFALGGSVLENVAQPAQAAQSEAV